MTNAAAQAAAERVIARCREIATFTEVPGETTRRYLCEPARAVQTLVRGWMEAAGMRAELDAAGNLRGFYAGTEVRSRRLLLGSHLDTVPDAGAFDGVLGVVLAVAVVEEMRGDTLPFSIEVIAFSEEEGVRFAQPFLGSMALVGRLDGRMLALRDDRGICVRDALRSFGLDPSRIDAAKAGPDAIGFVEVHIEQGPVLESAGLSLGLVDVIVGQSRMKLAFQGHANHAGTTPMALRHDPVAAAAEWISVVETRARATNGLVATVGRVAAKPGAANVIAAEATCSLDVRHASDRVRREAVEELAEAARSAGARRGVAVSMVTTMEQAAVPMSSELTAMLEGAAERSGHAMMRMASGAGHDAMVLAERMPAAMLFLRSPGGVSHHPEESVRVDDVAAAMETMREFLRMLGESEEAGRHA